MQIGFGSMMSIWGLFRLVNSYHILCNFNATLSCFNISEWLQAKDALWDESSVLGDLVKPTNHTSLSRTLGFGGTRQCVFFFLKKNPSYGLLGNTYVRPIQGSVSGLGPFTTHIGRGLSTMFFRTLISTLNITDRYRFRSENYTTIGSPFVCIGHR